jgi:hypothetical protein
MSNDKEAKARIKINKLLEEAGWRFFDTEEGKANIHLESHAKYSDAGLCLLINDLPYSVRHSPPLLCS